MHASVYTFTTIYTYIYNQTILRELENLTKFIISGTKLQQHKIYDDAVLIAETERIFRQGSNGK